MIIQSARLRVDLDIAALERHVYSGPANEAIIPLSGDQAALREMVHDAATAGKTYAIRHIKVSPGEPMSRTELGQVVCDLGDEFGFLPDRCVIIEHHKPRVAGGFYRHWHLLVPEYDPVRRRILDSHWMRPRQERIARVAELRLGHQLVTGRWNAAVARALVADDKIEAATAVAELATAPRPQSAFTAKRHQCAARNGVSLPHMKLAVTQAWERSDSVPAFKAALAEVGMVVRAGDMDGVWIVQTDGREDRAAILIGALHRLVQQPKRQVDAYMRTVAPEPRHSHIEMRHPGAGLTADGLASQPPEGSDHVATVRNANGRGSVEPGRRSAGAGGMRDVVLNPRDAVWPVDPRLTERGSKSPIVTYQRHHPRAKTNAEIHVDSGSDSHLRNRRWIAMCLRRHYELSWLSEDIVAHIVDLEWREADGALVLTLDTGSRLIDRYDQIELDGAADTVAIAELVACVRRRGWTRVQVEGSSQFRLAAAYALLAAGIEVEDPPVPASEAALLLETARDRPELSPDRPVRMR